MAEFLSLYIFSWSCIIPCWVLTPSLLLSQEKCSSLSLWFLFWPTDSDLLCLICAHYLLKCVFTTTIGSIHRELAVRCVYLCFCVCVCEVLGVAVLVGEICGQDIPVTHRVSLQNGICDVVGIIHVSWMLSTPQLLFWLLTAPQPCSSWLRESMLDETREKWASRIVSHITENKVPAHTLLFLCGDKSQAKKSSLRLSCGTFGKIWWG